MSIINSYDGYLSRQANLKSLDFEISKILLRGGFPGEGEDIKFVTDKHEDIDTFVHPYWRQAEDVVYIDTRGYSTVTADGTHTFRNGEEKDIWFYRARLELAWMRSDRTELFTAFQFANEVFVRWFTSLISHEFKLAPIHESRLMCCVALFNVGRYYNRIEGFRMVEKYVQQIATQYRIDVNTAFEIAELCGDVFPRNVDEFVDLVHRANISGALQPFNRGTLANILGSSFFLVANAPQITALAIEYPPAFVAIVLMAFKHTTIANRTQIGIRAKDTASGNKDKYFIRAIEATLDRVQGDIEPGRKVGTESMLGHEAGAGAIAAGVVGGGVFLAFIAWVLDKVFGGDKDPAKKAEESSKKLNDAISALQADSANIQKTLEVIAQSSWPDDKKLEALGDENKKIWEKLANKTSNLPGAKLAVYDFSKSGGKGSQIQMGKLKFDGADGSKFADNLGKACQFMATVARDNDPFVQGFVYALLSNKPFTTGDVNNAQIIQQLTKLYDSAANIMGKIAAAGDANALNAVQSDIAQFNTEVGAMSRKKNPDASQAEIDATRGAGGAVKHIQGLKSKTLQLFNKDTGDFNEEIKSADSEIKAIVEIYKDPSKAVDLAKDNAEAAKQLKAMAEGKKSAFESYKTLATDLDTKFDDVTKGGAAWKMCKTFVTGKNELIEFTQDCINNTNNVSKSLYALSASLISMQGAIAGKAEAPAGDKPAEPAKTE